MYKNKRIMFTVPDELKTDIAYMKKKMFVNQTYTEMYRSLIRAGLEADKANKRNKEKLIG